MREPDTTNDSSPTDRSDEDRLEEARCEEARHALGEVIENAVEFTDNQDTPRESFDMGQPENPPRSDGRTHTTPASQSSRGSRFHGARNPYRVGRWVTPGDRSNKGQITHVDGDRCSVHFRNPDTGATADKEFHWNELTPTDADSLTGYLQRPDAGPAPPWVPFPTDSLPEPCKAFVKETALALHTDEAMIAVPMLAAMAGALGAAADIEAKPGWVEPSILWTLTVAPSGAKKSRALGAIQAPFVEWEKSKNGGHKDRLDAWKNQCNAAKKFDQDSPERPVKPRSFLDDSTIEKSCEMLALHAHGLTLIKDELSTWFSSFVRYRSKGSDADQWLGLYDGRPVRNDRKSQDNDGVQCDHTRLSIFGGIQPKILAKRLTPEDFESGLVSRMLPVMPPFSVSQWTDENVSPPVKAGYHTLIGRMLDYRRASDDVALESAPLILPLSDEARAAFKAFVNRWGIVANQAEEDENPAAGNFHKLNGTALRLALVHHAVICLGSADPLDLAHSVALASIRFGMKLAEWFAYEVSRVFQALAEKPNEDEEDRHRRQLITLVERQEGRSITPRELHKLNNRRYPDSQSAESALDDLVRAGLGTWTDRPAGARGGRPARQFSLLRIDTADEFRPSLVTEERHPDTPKPPDVITFPSKIEGFGLRGAGVQESKHQDSDSADESDETPSMVSWRESEDISAILN